MNTLITGCAIAESSTGVWRWGDLHEEGTCFVHYCLQNEWQYGELSPALRAVTITDDRMYFERSGVLVIAKERCVMNSAAKEYLS